MSTGLQELLDDQLDEALEQLLLPRLIELIGTREPGHCLRITDLTTTLASRLCRRLHTASTSPHCYVLAADGSGPRVPADVAATSTKLVELRNPEAGASLRTPLVAFIPPGTRASAEDSFGVATFEEVAITDVYEQLAKRLADEIPSALHAMIYGELFATLDGASPGYADALARSRYLLTVKHNDFDQQAAGAAIFELGLVPDFDLFRQPGQVAARARTNLDAMHTLTTSPHSERQRVLELGLTDADLQRRLAEFAARIGLEDPRSWTRRIVIDSANWRLGFHEWALAKAAASIDIRIDVLNVDLPVVEADSETGSKPPLDRLVGQQYLLAGTRGRDKLATRFRIEPDPRKVPGLAKFSVQIHSEDGGPTGLATTVSIGKPGKTEYTATFAKLTKTVWDEGWHFVRVIPMDTDGLPIPMSSISAAHTAESDRFYVTSLDDPEIGEAPERAAGTAAGLIHALRAVQFNVLADGGDPHRVAIRSLARRPATRGRADVARVGFSGNTLIDVLLPKPLEQVQRFVLSEPQSAHRWRIPLSSQGFGEPARQHQDWPTAVDRHDIDAFIATRTTLFAAIRRASDLGVELLDLRGFREEIRSYVDTYKNLLAWHLRRAQTVEGANLAAALRALADLTAIDTVTVDITDHGGDQRQVMLVAPTHPMRLLWLMTWAELGETWLRWSAASTPEGIRTTRDTLMSTLSPQGFPFAVPSSDGRLLIAADDLSPFWGTYLPSETEDPQALIADLRAALKIASTTPAGGSDLAIRVADRIERYLRLHPYVDTLVINTVNPGRGDLLADALRAVQHRPGLGALRFNVRLIVDDPEAPGVNDALAKLVAVDDERRSEEMLSDTRVVDQLRPRFAVSVQSIAEFNDEVGEHSAHLTVLIDAFAVETFDAEPPASDGIGPERGRLSRGIAPVHGLVQKAVTHYAEADDAVAWRRQPRHGASYPLPGAEELSDLLAELPAVMSAAAAAVATADPATTRIPTVTLELGTADRVLLFQAHKVSDWVITVDRTLGLEYFDQAGRADRPDYVIDHDTDLLAAGRRRIVVSSRSADELQALLAPVVNQHGLRLQARHAGTFFDQMRLLSGCLAFKLASTARTQRTEVLGLGLARLYLDYHGVLQQQILVPLDAHQDLYKEPRRNRDSVASRVDLQRTDLALFDLNAQARRITCRLIEVKCYTTIGDITDYQRLKDRVAGQLDSSADIIAHHFDPRNLDTDRPDRTVKNLEFASLLNHYLERAKRHGVMDGKVSREAEWLIEHLDAGYRLDFTRTGLIFDLARPGTDTESEGGIEFHRIGRDLIQELADAVPTGPSPAAAAPDTTPSPPAISGPGNLAQLDLTLPRLEHAAFLTADRTHETPVGEPEVLDIEAPADPSSVGNAEAEISSLVTEPKPQPAEKSQDQHDSQPAVGHVPSGHEDTDPVDGQDHDAQSLTPDVFLGTSRRTSQFGVIGRTAGRTIALDLDETHTISLFGVQGGGKSYTLGSIIEMATTPIDGINALASPLATIVFHYSSTQDYAPEFTSMINANDEQAQIDALANEYGARPQALSDVVLLAPTNQVERRRLEYPGITVQPLTFNASELKAGHWRFLMGAVGNQSTYIRQLTRIMRANRDNLNLNAIRAGVDASNLSDALKQLAHQRLDLAADYIGNEILVSDLVRPGRLIIVDLRDEFIEKDEALGLFVVLMELFAEARQDGHHFNKLVVFDEAHKYIDSPDLVAGLVETVREMRHKGMSVLVASQDPPSVPIALIELSNHIVMHKFTSPSWLKHIQRANAALAGLTSEKMAHLAPGEAFVWSSKATDAALTRSAIKVTWRPRVTRHGGGTKTATGG